MSDTATVGYEAGEVCNRHGCLAAIKEDDSDGSCSCHLSAPCGYCTTPKEFCPGCGWDAEAEQRQIEKTEREAEREFWAKQRELERWKVRHFDPSQPQITARGHGSTCSMIKEGVVPNSMTKQELEVRVRGTFGGRFESYHEGPTHTRFRYIAYTD